MSDRPVLFISAVSAEHRSLRGTRTDPATGNQLLARAYRTAFEVSTREALPQYWAATQNNLANALRAQGGQGAGGG